MRDISDFNIDTFKAIKYLFYVGEDDYNTPAVPKCMMEIDHYDSSGNPVYLKDSSGNKIPKKDENGNLIMKLDKEGNMLAEYGEGYFSNYQINVLNRGLSSNPQERYDMTKDIYKSLGVDARFLKYPGDHITVNDNDSLYDDVFTFYEEEVLNKEKQL